MPIDPKKGENKKDFIARCMEKSYKENSEDKQRDHDQMVAICYSYWEQKNEKKVINRINKLIEVTTTADVDLTPVKKDKKKKKYKKKKKI